MPIDKFLTHFVQMSYQEGGFADPDIQEIDVAKSYLLQNNLNIAVFLHMLHNANKDLTNAMPDFEEWFWPTYRNAARYLNNRDQMKVMVSVCFSQEPASHWTTSFEYFFASVYEKRCGYFISSCSAMVEVETPIRLF